MPSLRRRAVLAAARLPYVYDLTKLGRVFGTDKVDVWHTRNGLAYTDIYERYLSAWRLRRFTLLELGVWRDRRRFAGRPSGAGRHPGPSSRSEARGRRREPHRVADDRVVPPSVPAPPRGSLYVMEDLSPTTYEDWPGHDAERGANWPAITQNPG